MHSFQKFFSVFNYKNCISNKISVESPQSRTHGATFSDFHEKQSEISIKRIWAPRGRGLLWCCSVAVSPEPRTVFETCFWINEKYKQAYQLECSQRKLAEDPQKYIYCSLNVKRWVFWAPFNIFIEGPSPFSLSALCMFVPCPHCPKRMAMIIRALIIITIMILALRRTSFVSTTVLSPFCIFTY